jgi:4-diphosphocytidyl-2-C-methyl-D-erythritol kinase
MFKSKIYNWSAMKKLTIKAFAKINLALDVIGKRKDGYHEVEMVMQGINLHDIVELEAIEGITLTCSIPELETGQGNLAYQAALLLKKRFNCIPGVKINLIKRIPIAAGLAGGSADAAAVLLGMNELFQIGLTLAELEKLAAELGSDVPFCLHPLTALAQGRGEIIKELATCPVLDLVLIKPSFDVSTKEIYEHLQNVSVINRPNIKEVVHALENKQIQEMIEEAGNVLEYATYDLYPQLREYYNHMIAKGAKKVMMSGSGPTLIAFLPNQFPVQKMATAMNKFGWRIHTVRTLIEEDLKGRMI